MAAVEGMAQVGCTMQHWSRPLIINDISCLHILVAWTCFRYSSSMVAGVRCPAVLCEQQDTEYTLCWVCYACRQFWLPREVELTPYTQSPMFDSPACSHSAEEALQAGSHGAKLLAFVPAKPPPSRAATDAWLAARRVRRKRRREAAEQQAPSEGGAGFEMDANTGKLVPTAGGGAGRAGSSASQVCNVKVLIQEVMYSSYVIIGHKYST